MKCDVTKIQGFTLTLEVEKPYRGFQIDTLHSLFRVKWLKNPYKLKDSTISGDMNGEKLSREIVITDI